MGRPLKYKTAEEKAAAKRVKGLKHYTTFVHIYLFSRLAHN